MNVNTAQCLTYLHDGLTLDPCWSLLKAPVLSRLYNNILELDITVVQESKSLLNDILMNLENIKRLTLNSVSASLKFVCQILESNKASIKYLYFYDSFGDVCISAIIRPCLTVKELTVECIGVSNSNTSEETANLDPA